MPVDKSLFYTQFSPYSSYFVFKKGAQRLYYFKIHLFRQAAYIVVGLDSGRRPFYRSGLYYIRVNSALSKPFGTSNLSGLFVKYFYKSLSDGFAFCLGVGNAFEGGEDYALVGTCPAPFWPELARVLSGFATPSLMLGTVRKGPLTLNGHGPQSAGFDHFSC